MNEREKHRTHGDYLKRVSSFLLVLMRDHQQQKIHL
jgi:hypothetical protein